MYSKGSGDAARLAAAGGADKEAGANAKGNCGHGGAGGAAGLVKV